MHRLRIELGDTGDGDAVALFDGERVIGRLEFDQGAKQVIAQMHFRLKIECVRIRQPRIEPAEERPDMRALFLVEASAPFFEVRLAQ